MLKSHSANDALRNQLPLSLNSEASNNAQGNKRRKELPDLVLLCMPMKKRKYAADKQNQELITISFMSV